MESILITPKNEMALKALKSWLKEMKDSFVSMEIAEGDVYYPELDKKIQKALEERKQGISYKVNTDSFEKFLESI